MSFVYKCTAALGPWTRWSPRAFYAPRVSRGVRIRLSCVCRRRSAAQPLRRQNGFTLEGTGKLERNGAVKETSQGTFAKGVDTKWSETQTVAKGVTSLLPRKSDEIFNFKSSPRREETVSVPPRG